MIEIGQSVGNYTILSKLGEGGMGTVYLAEHPVIGRKVAFKAIHPQFARNAEIVSRFVTEAKAVNQIGHQHIVDITDFGNTPDGDFYFIMEYLPGDTLTQSIRRAGRFPTERALRIAIQIADALEASHRHGVIHRDLKPDNVILIKREDDEDFVKVLDFGLAKLTRAVDAPAHNTDLGSVMGTPFYMAPEQCEGRVEIDHRADIYALGVMLFEMVTGKLPFGGSGYGEIIMKHMTTPPPAARSLVPELSPAIDLILLRALSKDPSDRFQSMDELRRALNDPDYYQASAPAMQASDLSARVLAAMPMARTELKLSRGGGPSSQPPPIRSEAPRSALSTFSHSVGQIEAASELGQLRPKRSRGAAVLLSLAMVAVLAVAGVRYRREASRIVVSVLSPRAPKTTRLNFSSDPDGATVTSADGMMLGMTPLSIDVPFGNAGLVYVLSKKGYLAKRLAAVPNLPAPLFAALEHDPAVKLPAELVIVPAAPLADIVEGPPQPAAPASVRRSPPRWTVVRTLPHHARHAEPVDDDPARDDSMQPTVVVPPATTPPSDPPPPPPPAS